MLTTSAVGAMLNNIPTAWAVPLAASVGLLSYHLSTFCPIDPPGYPTFSLGDWALIFSAAPGPDAAVARQKLLDTIDTFLWYQMCVCSVGSTPAAPTAPSAPADAPTVNPPGVGPSYPTGTPCYSDSTAGAVTTGASDTVGPMISIVGATSSVWNGTTSGANPTSGSYSVSVQFFDSTPTYLGQGAAFGFSTSGLAVDSPIAVPAGATQYRLIGNNVSAYNGTNGWSGSFDLYCGSDPGGTGGPVPTPCAADPSVQITLGQILSLLTLIQRNAVPFAYIPGASHIGLSGSGSLTIPSCIGVAVTLTTIGSYVGEVVGTPLEYFSAGWFSWGDTLGFEERVWIAKSPQLSFPSKAEQFTRLDYNLNPGVVATIQELYAEP